MIDLAKRENDMVVDVAERTPMLAVEKLRQAEIQRQRQPKFSLKTLFSQLQHRFSQAHDVSDLIEAQVKSRTAELYRKANFDALTHLPNRGYLQDILDQLVRRHQELQHPFSLLFLDLDGFKGVNDELGHGIGDELLRHVSARLLASVRDGDIVSRLGGDEFVVLLADTDAVEVIEGICLRIIDEVSRPYCLGGQEVKTSSSIGISRFPIDAKTTTELLEKADEALYHSKHEGKKTFRFYQVSNPKAKEVLAGSLRIAAFEKAVELGEITLQVEPQMDLQKNRLLGASLAVCWPQAAETEQGLEGLRDLLALSDAAQPLGLWLLDSGLYYSQIWLKKHAELVVTIPVIAAVWRRVDFESLLAQRFDQYGVKPTQIQLEFALLDLQTEGSLLIQQLKSLTAKGYQVSLSGLGAQVLDFNLMADLAIQEFKFDQAWLKKQLKNPTGQKWLQAMIQMGKALDACVICPGLESKHQVKTLVEMGCSIGQGVLWTQPLAIEIFLKD
ncbi:MAG: diguanylate cyclase [Thiotrichales bacterium]|nr:diguanylate cyclase [Thiotrichales bacterium]